MPAARHVLLCSFALAIALPAGLGAQSLYMPRPVKRAFAAGTRSPDGKPGAKYWQNRGRYTMTLTTRPPDRTVTGTEEIVYFNNSPDTLSRVVIRLIANIHKPGAARSGNAREAYLTSGVHVDTFRVNGRPQAWSNDVFTVVPVVLPQPLLPHDSIRLSFDWHYDMSREAGREGAIDSTTFFMAYAYPRVSVYDDWNGWDMQPFTDQLEFYSDFNDYDVTVRVPAGFVVWGTGNLVNAAEVLQPAVLARFQASLTSDTTIRVATAADMRGRSVTRQEPMNAWRFAARNVPDVTFATSDHYVWDAGSVVVDDAAHRRASVQAAYADSAADYPHMVRFARHALDWFSHKWPGVPYPYEKTTVVQGPAGMEYPMMANDESYADTLFSRFVAEHEIAHTYFPFWMGINETRHGFMDEGWATALEYLISRDDMGAEAAAAAFRQFRVQGWLFDRGPDQDAPIVTPFIGGNNAYVKPALGYLALKEMLGDSLFRKALHGYMDRWNGKHPTPWDFFNSFNDVTGRNLNWFWQSWYFGHNWIDLGLASVTRTAGGYRVAVDNVGGMPAPFDLEVTYADGTHTTIHQTPAVWRTTPRRTTITIPGTRRVSEVKVSGGIWGDADAANDRRVVGP